MMDRQKDSGLSVFSGAKRDRTAAAKRQDASNYIQEAGLPHETFALKPCSTKQKLTIRHFLKSGRFRASSLKQESRIPFWGDL
jgi:hypothetical protein